MGSEGGQEGVALLYAPQHPRCTPSVFNRPKDVQGCSAAPEEFTPTAFLVLFRLCLRFPTRVRACNVVFFCLKGVGTASGPPTRWCLSHRVPAVLQKGARPTCSSTPSSTDFSGPTRFVSCLSRPLVSRRFARVCARVIRLSLSQCPPLSTKPARSRSCRWSQWTTSVWRSRPTGPSCPNCTRPWAPSSARSARAATRTRTPS